MSATYPQTSLLGLPGELRNRIYDFVAARVTEVHVSATTEVPFILSSEARVVPDQCKWYNHGVMTDEIISAYSRCVAPLTELYPREIASKPAPKTTMAQHPLLHTSRQLRQEFFSILQSPATRPLGIEANVVDFNFSPLLTQLDHYSSTGTDVLDNPSKKVCAINIRLSRGKASFKKVQQNLNFLRQHVAIKPRSRSKRSVDISFTHNCIYYTIQLQTEYEWYTKEDYIMSIERLFASQSIFDDAMDEVGGSSITNWLRKSGLDELLFAHEKTNVHLLAMFAPADVQRNTRLRRITSMGPGEADWVGGEILLKEVLEQVKGPSKPKHKKRAYFRWASCRSTNQKGGIHDRRWIG